MNENTESEWVIAASTATKEARGKTPNWLMIHISYPSWLFNPVNGAAELRKHIEAYNLPLKKKKNHYKVQTSGFSVCTSVHIPVNKLWC